MSNKIRVKFISKESCHNEDNSSDEEDSSDEKDDCTLISKPILYIDNVYLIRRSNTNSYKIGHSNNPNETLKAMQIDNDVTITLVACCPGGKYMKKQFHNKYSKCNILGEWFKFNSLQVLEVMGDYARIRLGNGELKEQTYNPFNNKKDVFGKILDIPIEEIVKDKDDDKCLKICIFKPDVLEPDPYSITVIEKLHINGNKYIKIIQSIISSYFIVTKNKYDYIRLKTFKRLFSNMLTSKDYDRVKLDKHREIIDMVIIRLNNYSVPDYMERAYNVDIEELDTKVIAYLKVNPSLFLRFNRELDYDNCIENFNKRYGTSISTINIDEVKQVVEYIKKNSFLVRIDVKEFSIISYKLSSFLRERIPLNLPLNLEHFPEYNLEDNDNFTTICVIACYILGCKIRQVVDKIPHMCSIGIHIDLEQIT